MKIKDVINHLEGIAPLSLQEGYDNAGLITGHPETEIRGVLCCLDSTEAVIEEAIQKDCNLVVAHHPIIFKGLKRITGRNYVERTVIKAIKHDIAIYAIHTNLDNVRSQGVNERIAQKLGLENIRLLAPKNDRLLRYEFHCPVQEIDQAKATVQTILAQHLSPGDDHLFGTVGAVQGSEGQQGGGFLSFLAPNFLRNTLETSLLARHQVLGLQVLESQNVYSEVGSGMVGDLPAPTPILEFLQQLKATMQAGVVRYTKPPQKMVQRIAVCGGAGGFLLGAAKGTGADVFITSDYKYHEFFDADGALVIADIGHFESEQYTINLLEEIISQKFSNFAVHCTSVNTNPVYYL